MKKKIAIMWFRQDLRLADNPALYAAAEEGIDVLPIYIMDDCAPSAFKLGASTKLWLHYSLASLNQSLDHKLNFWLGNAKDIIKLLIERYDVKGVFWNKCYEPWHVIQEKEIAKLCHDSGIKLLAANGNYLYAPEEIMKSDGSYYKVFTAYKNRTYCFNHCASIEVPDFLNCLKDNEIMIDLSDFNLVPEHRWHNKIKNCWDIGEVAAKQKLDVFIANHLSGYKNGRNYPLKKHVSKLSPHLHFGEISPLQIFHAVQDACSAWIQDPDVEHFISELTWREFSCYLLNHFGSLYQDNFNNKFDFFGWEEDAALLKAWQQGMTGYPLIDAGMRELWQTGYMHNRIRMVVASFLVKNLNIHWHKGRDWFWDCLLDADLANNSASWQWVAGCGADAAPYFRVFNPIIQGKKFDEDGAYTKKFIPELAKMPKNYLFAPWTAPESVLKSAGVVLGTTYPKPIIDFAMSRNSALSKYREL